LIDLDYTKTGIEALPNPLKKDKARGLGGTVIINIKIFYHFVNVIFLLHLDIIGVNLDTLALS
jgi:hypothetical protein